MNTHILRRTPFVVLKMVSAAKSRWFIAAKRFPPENLSVLRRGHAFLLQPRRIHRDKTTSFSAGDPFTAANRLQPQNLPTTSSQNAARTKFSRPSVANSFSRRADRFARCGNGAGAGLGRGLLTF